MGWSEGFGHVEFERSRAGFEVCSMKVRVEGEGWIAYERRSMYLGSLSFSGMGTCFGSRCEIWSLREITKLFLAIVPSEVCTQEVTL